MIDSDTQAKLDRLAKIDQANRDRSRRYLERIKAEGKKQISAIVNSNAFEELNRRRDASIQAGKPLSYGGVIEAALFPDTNTDVKKNVNIDKQKPIEQEIDLFGIEPYPGQIPIIDHQQIPDMSNTDECEAFVKKTLLEIAVLRKTLREMDSKPGTRKLRPRRSMSKGYCQNDKKNSTEGTATLEPDKR